MDETTPKEYLALRREQLDNLISDCEWQTNRAKPLLAKIIEMQKHA